VQYAPQISSTINLVASGLGISIVPSCMRNSRERDVRYISVNNSSMVASLGLAHRRNGLSPVVENLISLVPKQTSKKSH
jgi:DNA-binding transcriptional LysR family regulator